jgi:antirestriction protein ArdC
LTAIARANWKTNREAVERRDPMQEFTDKILESLEAGVKPWVRPWDPSKCAGPQAPLNPTTGARYHGINVLILACSILAFTTADPRWCTYQQAQEKKWQVRKGEKSTTIFFYKLLAIEDEKAEDKTKIIPILKHYSVFHASQIDGIPPHVTPTVEEAPWTRPDAADIILKSSGAVVHTGGDRAFYSPTTDHIQLPPDNAFRGPSELATTFLHELCHWTGHLTRLSRIEAMKAKYGSSAYAMEELRAEIASAFIAAELGIPSDIAGHASYISSWLKPLKEDKREIFKVAADAQKIVDMVLGFHPDFAALVESQPDRPMSVEHSTQSGTPIPV